MKKETIICIVLILFILIMVTARKPITKFLSRGYKNNNVGNIRISDDKFKGEILPSQDNAFKQFDTIENGYRAIFKLLQTYITKYGANNIDLIIKKYAPSNENDTTSYINSVVSHSGINPTTPISTTDSEKLIKLVAAISKHENGIEPDMNEVVNGYKLLFS
jgi:hypothetical protein